VFGTVRNIGEIVNGNVGINSSATGQLLDVIGTERASLFTMSGASPASGFVLTSVDSSGHGSWTAPGGVSGWTISGNNVYETNSGNVGIGTTSLTQGALLVTNGNVGIGTWTASQALQIGGYMSQSVATPVTISLGGTYSNTAGANLKLRLWDNGVTTYGIGISLDQIDYSVPGSYADHVFYQGTNELMRIQGTGNVGIGSASPGQLLDVQGTIRAIGGEAVIGNVGIGTSALQTAFAVTNGNVGIGTWTASSGLQILRSFAVYRSATAASVTSASQTIIGVTSTAATRTITLATADTVAGRVIIVKDESGGAGTNNITVTTQGGQTIDGAASITISSNYGVVRVYSDGTNWFTF
jgi:hypothetical protein